MRWVTAFLAMVIATPVAAQQIEVTLNEAVQRALQVQPAMVQARGEQRTAGADRLTAWGAFLPTVTATYNAARRWDSDQQRIDPSTGQPVQPVYVHTPGLSASLELFDGLRRFNTLKQRGASLEAAEAGVVNQRFTVILATKQAFYTAIANEALVTVAEAQVRRAAQQLQISVEKLHAGSATRSDSLRSTVEYGNARIALLRARANLATAQASLGRQVGVDVPVRATPDSALPPLPDTAALRVRAIERAPQVERAEAQARAARADLRSTRSQYLPTVTLTYSDNRQGTQWPSFPSFDGFAENYTWSFGLRWMLFNGFTRENNQSAAAVRFDNAAATAADTRRSITAQLTQQLAAMATSYEQIDIAMDNVAAATEDLRVQNERYRVGAATILDLLTSQTALTTAEQNLVQARLDYLVARAQVEAVVGRTL
ncbi:MAG TPA: TolC family protein [Gemmatimonadales bacterium]|jgi:outer membrane protein|nr:TolC family protein [Gemmatimonadales bacterium]